MRSLALPLLAAVLLVAGCDSGGDPPAEKEALFRVEVADAQGDPVEGLRVGVRPCFTESCDPQDLFRPSSTMPGTEATRAATRPVQLVSFDVQTDGRDAILTWTTESEQDNSGFELARYAEDSSSWTQVAFVESKAAGGTTEETQSYSYRDAALPTGKYTYRLVQVDINDHKEGISTVHAIVFPEGEVYLREGPSPNPFRRLTNIDLAISSQTRHVTAEVQELTGTPIATFFDHDNTQGEAGQGLLRYEPDADTPDGLYRFVIEGETFADTTYAVLMRPENPIPRHLGATGPDGIFSTNERTPFPALFNPPTLERKIFGNETVGEFAVADAVVIVLTNPNTGEYKTYQRTVRDGANTFALTWNP